MEYSETIPTARVSMIIDELTNFLIFRTNVSVGVRSNGMLLQIIPVAIAVRTSTSVIFKVIVGTCDPEAGWRLISIKQRPASLGHNDTVRLNEVLLFNSIFDKDNVTLNIIRHVVDDPQKVRAV